jgi:hypothetical protein
MKYIIPIILLFVAISCSSLKDRPAVGVFSMQQWIEITKMELMDNGMFSNDQNRIVSLKEIIKKENIGFIIAASSTCEECHEKLPILFALFNEIEVDKGRIRVIGLDEDLTEPTGVYKTFDIQTTPSVFIQKDGKTIGSLVYPDTDWLSGFTKILMNIN